MGYRTTFTLEITEMPDERTTPDDALAELLATNEEAAYCLDDEGQPKESGKWYDHTDHLREFSKRHPHLLFKLSGEGEENDDIWDEYYLNGKVQQAKATIMKPPFDPEQLR